MPISRRILDRQAATSLYGRTAGQELSYDTPGMTLGGAVPEGYRERTVSAVVGSGDEVFARVGDGLMHWALPIGAGFGVKTQHAAVTEGARAAFAVPTVWPLAVVGATRVVGVVATGRSYGYALGTLASHPASGEELTLVTQHDDGRVEVSLRSVSRPARWWARLGLGAQERAMKKQLAAAARLATAPSAEVVVAG